MEITVTNSGDTHYGADTPCGLQIVGGDPVEGQTVRVRHDGALWDCVLRGRNGRPNEWIVKATAVSKRRRQRFANKCSRDEAWAMQATPIEGADRNILFPQRGVGIGN